MMHCDASWYRIESNRWHDNRNRIESWNKCRFTPLALFIICYVVFIGFYDTDILLHLDAIHTTIHIFSFVGKQSFFLYMRL